MGGKRTAAEQLALLLIIQRPRHAQAQRALTDQRTFLAVVQRPDIGVEAAGTADQAALGVQQLIGADANAALAQHTTVLAVIQG
ncbi:hypothetical protein PS880_06213 [Pseudomonas fluorescens]|uniref:Uncharacterized protein n=1 Tax=Pseudomonas fluorescens TaxID=294 RepID=A0A5E7QH46_PSEFL|nr:hypothetical protein PS880_06213 [Pseudomonas fluorescens]